MDLFDLVNMDGRVYDPVIGRFLSADPVIQDPENLQSLNRYSYCLNNPLSLTDPSGYSWFSDNWRSLLSAAIAITVSVVSLGSATALGAIILSGGLGGFAGGFSGVLLNGGNLGQALVAGVIGGAIGAATAFLSCGAGEVEKGLSKTAAIFEKAAKHAFADTWMGGVKSAIYGGSWSPIRDMIGGALSSAGNGEIEENVNGIALKMASSAILGGTISEIGGGKFANGAITGAYSMLFNDLMHEVRVKNKSAWFGSNFIGPGPSCDPDDIKDENGYKLKPIDEVDLASKAHDKAYFEEGADGVQGALFNSGVKPADAKLISACYGQIC